MSLIPSESYSFPDHFTTTVVPTRKPKQQKAEIEKKKPRIVALPDPEPDAEPLVATDPGQPQTLSEIWEPEMAQIQPASRSHVSVHPENWSREVPQTKVPLPPVRPVPSPALRRAQAPPPRIADAPVRKIASPQNLKPKVRWNNRAPAMDPTQVRSNGNGNGNGNGLADIRSTVPLPAQNVIPMKVPRSVPRQLQNVPPAAMTQSRVQSPAATRSPQPVLATPRSVQPKVAPRPVQPKAMPRPVPSKPAPPRPQPPPPIVTNSQADFFETFAEDGHSAATRHRRETKFRRFIACEGAALVVLLPLVILGLTVNVSIPGVRWIMDIFTITAAVSAALIPIIFYAFTPTLPEIER